MDGSQRHRPTIELLEPFPDEVLAGETVDVAVRVSCPGGCDLVGGVLEVVSADEARQTAELSGADDHEEDVGTAALSLKAPPKTGEAEWTIRFPGLEAGGCVHEECTLPVTCEVLPHTTSVAIWGVPSAVRGSRFTVNVGIKCAARCALGGQLVEVRDDAGVKLGGGPLGDDPRPGTEGLYEAEVGLVAPDRLGVVSASAGFVSDPTGLPHLGSSGDFTFRCLEPPEHIVGVRVVPHGFDAPLEDIEVRVGAYQAMTDSGGVARVAVANGACELSVWRIDIESVTMKIQVDADTEIDVGVEPRRVVDEDEERMWM